MNNYFYIFLYKAIFISISIFRSSASRLSTSAGELTTDWRICSLSFICDSCKTARGLWLSSIIILVKICNLSPSILSTPPRHPKTISSFVLKYTRNEFNQTRSKHTDHIIMSRENGNLSIESIYGKLFYIFISNESF